MVVDNPLLNQGSLPDFKNISHSQVFPSVKKVIEDSQKVLHELENLKNPTWENFALRLRNVQRKLDQVWGVVNHLMNVKNTSELRSAHEKALPMVIEFSMKISQSEKLYLHWKNLEKDSEIKKNKARERIVLSNIVNAELAGVNLGSDKKNQFRELQNRLANLSTQFSNNVLDATAAYTLLLCDRSEVEGLPESWLLMGSQIAKEHGHSDSNPKDGPWMLTLDMPVYVPFLQHAKNRKIREKAYRANIIRASGVGFSSKWDNKPIIAEILKLRAQAAELLGYENYAQVSLKEKMAASTQDVYTMIDGLAKIAKEFAEKEMDELDAYAKEKDGLEKCEQWDIPFYTERRKEELFGLNDETIKPFFPLPQVLSGLFFLAKYLFGVEVRESTEKVSLWNKDVLFFEIFDAGNKKIAAFYLDPYTRSQEKRSGAWMDVCRQKEQSAQHLTLPVAYLVCNGSSPVGNTPSLMTFRDVETLFHEFGHGLQHMLTDIDEYEVSGISNVEWDAVELPSQFMENWVYESFVMDKISGHYETGKKLPQKIFKSLVEAKSYMSGSYMLRQCYFSILDLNLHENNQSYDLVAEIKTQIAKKYTTRMPLKEDAFLCSFGHIFAGGYAAGYYSYKWAEVLSADAFAAFEEVGLKNESKIKELGKHFRKTILGLGGSRHPSEVYELFRGRPASIDALLRHSGLKKAALAPSS